ncbi:MAG TPA: hypothetical protein VLX91_05715 [Candidatus Acidoferrales bacterium]|nr:hypothetical protein [Candidatus Acidoferrales bacterium]
MIGDAAIPFVRRKSSTYENFYVDCPYCGFPNTFNRATDFQSFEPIARLQVTCQKADCAKSFFIGGDLVNPAWQMLIVDCHALKSQKHYAYCILNLAQAFEVYLSLFLRVELLYKPYAKEGTHDLDHLNRLFELLYCKTKKFTFNPLSNVFMNMIVGPPNLRDLSEAEVFINCLPSKTTCPSDDSIGTLSDKALSQLLVDLKNPFVMTFRHQVVHKRAYRPTLQEVESSMDETQRLLYGLDHKLGLLNDDLNYYVGLANGG